MTNFLNKTFFDTPLLVMWGDKSPEDGKSARLTFGFRDGRPRFTVNTGQATGRDGMIIFPGDVPTVTSMMLMLDEIANGEPDKQVINDSLTPVYVDNKVTAERKVRGSLIIGKTKDGVCYITVVAEGFPKLVFPFKPSEWHVFRDGSRNVIPLPHVSSKLAHAYSLHVRNLISMAIMQHAQEEYGSGSRKLSSVEKSEDGSSNYKGKSQNAAKKPDNSRFQDIEDLVI